MVELRVVAVAIVLALSGQAAAKEFPVQVEVALPAGVETAAAAARLWSKDIAFRVKLEGQSSRTREVRSCAEYESARGEGFSAETTAEARCLALLLKKTLRPARQSFVRALKLDAQSVRWLPAILGFPVGEASYQKQVERAIENGTSFGSYFITLSDRLAFDVETAKPLHLGFRLKGQEAPDLYRLDLVGRGDWNGDGLDDLVLDTYHGYMSNAAESCLLVLTRKSSTDRIRIVWGRCHLSDNWQNGPPTPIEKRFLTLNADLGCSGDAADEERDRFDKRYRTKALPDAYASLLKLYDRCRTRLAAPQRVRLVGTLILGAHRLKRQADCRRLASERSENEVYASPKSRNALRHNLKLCLPGEKVTDPTAKYD